jgi:Arc/MetJ-type ribon-helix-helix transcriptional regulator
MVKQKQVISVSLPEIFLAGLQRLEEVGIVDSVSQAVRMAIRDFYPDEIRFGMVLHNALDTENDGAVSENDC